MHERVETEPVATPAPLLPAPTAPQSRQAAVMQLQRTAGNRAVTRMLQRDAATLDAYDIGIRTVGMWPAQQPGQPRSGPWSWCAIFGVWAIHQITGIGWFAGIPIGAEGHDDQRQRPEAGDLCQDGATLVLPRLL
jgi:hypothetical protein